MRDQLTGRVRGLVKKIFTPGKRITPEKIVSVRVRVRHVHHDSLNPVKKIQHFCLGYINHIHVHHVQKYDQPTYGLADVGARDTCVSKSIHDFLIVTL